MLRLPDFSLSSTHQGWYGILNSVPGQPYSNIKYMVCDRGSNSGFLAFKESTILATLYQSPLLRDIRKIIVILDNGQILVLIVLIPRCLRVTKEWCIGSTKGSMNQWLDQLKELRLKLLKRVKNLSRTSVSHYFPRSGSILFY